MPFDFSPVPPLFDKQAYQRKYNKSDKGKTSRKAYRHNNSKHTTDAVYLSRKIVAIDGEGINIRSGLRTGDHIYVMLAIGGKSPILDSAGLKTQEILDYLWENLNADDINVIYGGSYDFNLWVRDLMEDQLASLYRSGFRGKGVFYGGYHLRWVKGKMFQLARYTEMPDGKPLRETRTINDVISFFQRPFIQACDEYLGEYDGRDELVREKARRGDFTVDELAAVGHYNQLELVLLTQLVEELRRRLNRVGLRPSRWNSPGAIASALFLRERVKQHRNESLPPGVSEAARYAYAGGRFEMIKYGSVKEPVYEYDINSAYPSAMRALPSLSGGRWHHFDNRGNSEAVPFGLYRVRFFGNDGSIPGPIFHRADNGTISYPLSVTNWVWTPEYEALQEYCAQIPGASYELLESWEYEEAAERVRPFAFIDALYLKRKELKAKGDGAHVGIKLALNIPCPVSRDGAGALAVSMASSRNRSAGCLPPLSTRYGCRHTTSLNGRATSPVRAGR